MDKFVLSWLILAAVFFVFEMFTAGFFLACFGVGCAAASIAAALKMGTVWQVAFFALFTFLSFLFSRKFAEKVTGEQAQGVGVDRVLGKKGVVLEEISRTCATGMVRVDREEWRAITEDDSTVSEGVTVIVIRVDGTKLVVKKED